MSTASDQSPDLRLWQGQTGSERVDERRRRLMDAAFELLGTEGATAVTVRAVTRVSGLSPRYFYESFTDREELLREVFDDRFAIIKRAVAEAMAVADEDFDARARASLDATARCLEDDPRLGRAMLRETLADETLRLHAERALPEFVLGVALEALGNDFPEDLDVAALQVAVLSVAGVQVTLFLAWCEGELKLGREELVERVIAVVNAIVGTVL
jgi:AcrR family transcriptional regulator